MYKHLKIKYSEVYQFKELFFCQQNRPCYTTYILSFLRSLGAISSLFSFASLSKQELFNQLTSPIGAGFTRDEADYALSELGF